MRYKQSHVEQIKEIIPQSQIDIIEANKKTIKRYLPKADILIYSSFENPNLIDFKNAQNLKWVHVTSAGTSEIESHLKNTDILLTSSSGVHPVPIAEQIFTYILMFARCMNKSYRTQIKEKKWTQDNLSPYLTELFRSTIGIIGYGRIGKRVAKIAKAFGMNVIALEHINSLGKDTNVDNFYQNKDLNNLLQKSDFVINCLPLTAETTHFFKLATFKQMKPTSYFINIGRGKTVDENDLIIALKKGIIAGAGLDVFDIEPLPENSELWKLENVIITPHYAGWTPSYIDRVITIFCSNLKAYLSDMPMLTLVDKTGLN